MDERQKKFNAGEFIFRDGDAADSLYILLDGRVRITKTILGQETTLTTLGKGAIFGEMAVVDNQPRSASAIADSAIICFEISRKLFNLQLNKVPKWLQAFFAIIVERVREATKKESLLMVKGAGRQVTLLAAMMLSQQAAEGEIKAGIPWDSTVRTMAFLMAISEDAAGMALETLCAAGLSQDEKDGAGGRRLSTANLERLKQFARFCEERYVQEGGQIAELSEEFHPGDPLAIELLAALEATGHDQAGAGEVEEGALNKYLDAHTSRSLDDFRATIEALQRDGLLEVQRPAEGAPLYRLNQESYKTIQEKTGLLSKLSDLEKKII